LSEGRHILQLFDAAESATNALATFLCDGWEADDWMLVVTKMRNWDAAKRRLRRRGLPVDRAVAEGRLIVLDAVVTCPAIMDGELPDRHWFFTTIGRLVARMWTASGGRLRIYSEHGEILAEEGNFDGACRLEELWEEVRRQYAFTVLCGYSAAHFADVARAAALRSVCQCHTEVRCQSADILARWLLRHDRALGAAG
jgi:DcmR-like sensory protein